MSAAPRPRHALLIDDEPLARMELRRLLRPHAHVAIAGEAGTMIEARARLGHPGYDLVFLDVQLRGGNGFDLLDAIAPAAQVVFVTAYDRYAVRAFEVNALDYLLKPVTAARLAATLQRLESPLAPAPAGPPARGEPARLAHDDRVYVKTGHATRFIAVADIGAIRSCENYTELALASGEKLLVLRSLKSWEEALPEEQFARVHRQALVNLARVRQITRRGEDEVLFEFAPPLAPVAASRRQLAELKQRFAAAGFGAVLP
jgi:two-component system LytT family response regulator